MFPAVKQYLTNPVKFDREGLRPSDTDIESYVNNIYKPFASTLVYKSGSKYKGLMGCLASIYAYCMDNRFSFPMACWIDGYQLYVIKPLLMAFEGVWVPEQTFNDINSNMKTTKFFTCMVLPDELSDLMAIYHPPLRFFEKIHETLPHMYAVPDAEVHAMQHYRARGRNRPCGCHETRLKNGYYWDSMIPLLLNVTSVVTVSDLEYIHLE